MGIKIQKPQCVNEQVVLDFFKKYFSKNEVSF